MTYVSIFSIFSISKLNEPFINKGDKMARTVRRKSKDDLMLEKERDGTNNKRKGNVARSNKKNKLRQLDYTDPSVLDELDNEYEY